jgi:hypothetical protein
MDCRKNLIKTVMEELVTANNINDIYMKAIDLSRRFDQRFLDLARTLRELKTVDPALFRLCIANSHISTRKAYYLLTVIETFDKLHVPDERLQAIGWTKLTVMAKHVNKDNIKEALKLAETARTRDLKVLVKGKWPEKKPHCVLMYLTTAQYEVFSKVLLQFGAKHGPRGLIGKEEALIAFIEAHNEFIAYIRAKAEGKI